MEQLDITNIINKSFQVSDNIVCEKFDDCLILLDLGKNKFFKLNDTGTAILELVQQGKHLKIFALLKKDIQSVMKVMFMSILKIRN